jgi:uncharacterized RDD family membrane protein YckC
MTDEPSSPPPSPPPGGEYPPPPPAAGGYAPPPPGPAIRGLPQQAYASWIIRVAAFVIDFLPVWILSGISYGIMGASFATTTCTGGECTGPSPAAAVIQLVAWLLTLVFELWNRGYRQGTTGQSIGKSAMKIKLVSEATGQPIGFGMAFVRDIAHFVDSITFFIGFLFPLWDAKRQTLADKIISTVVLPTA